MPHRKAPSTRDREAARHDPFHYELCLFIVGATPRSARAIANIRAICDQRLSGRFDLKVIDINQQPWLASVDQIVAAPTLLKRHPLPQRRLIGDFTSRRRVLAGLDLPDDASPG